MGEITREVRFLNVPLGASIALSPYLLGRHAFVDQIVATFFAILTIGPSLPRGKRGQEHHSTWNHLIV